MSSLTTGVSDQAAAQLARFRESVLGHFIAGRDVRASDGGTFANLSPADGGLLAEVAAGTVEDVDAASRAANDAFERWSRTDGVTRRALLHRVADLIEDRAEEIAHVESTDTGQPIRFMSKAAVRGAANFRYFADLAPSAANGEALPAPHHTNVTSRQPLGPVGVITPWNTPFMLSTWKIAPALAAGCTVVHKPAEWSPLSARLLAEAIHEAGLPEGAVNVVNGMGEVAGRAVTEHPLLRGVAFVGESATGSAIMSQGAPTLKRVHFELGGKNPVLVFPDADLDRALDAVTFMIFSLNGERCTSSSRLLVHRSIHDEFVEHIVGRISQLRVGDPLDAKTHVGPLIHPRHVAKVEGYVEWAQSAGLTVHRGQAPSESANDGWYVRPTVFAGGDNATRVAREEIFGPVLTVIPFDDDDDAVAIANDTPYGLAAYVWTRDVGRANRITRNLDAGMIWVNSENNRHLPSPFGGMKASGIGRDGGDHSFDFYMETKNVCFALDTHRVPHLG